MDAFPKYLSPFVKDIHDRSSRNNVVPDGTFPNLSASKYVDRVAFITLQTPIDGFLGSEIVKCSVGI